jgi:hypothetical protein
MMCHELPQGAMLWPFLLAIDQDIAEQARQSACPCCGGRLDCANYPRRPRGVCESLPEQFSRRLSFCCDRDGCRKRVTPPSVRFLGRKVYLAAIVVLVAAMRHGPTPRRVAELSRLVGADRASVSRWQRFWRERFPHTPFWKVARGQLAPTFDVAVLPHSLLEAFAHADPCRAWGNLLRFLSPISIAGAPTITLAR